MTYQYPRKKIEYLEEEVYILLKTLPNGEIVTLKASETHVIMDKREVARIITKLILDSVEKAIN